MICVGLICVCVCVCVSISTVDHIMRNSTFTGIQPNSSEFAGYIKYTTPSESGVGFWNCSDHVIFFFILFLVFGEYQASCTKKFGSPPTGLLGVISD
jgi:hypothetical protein